MSTNDWAGAAYQRHAAVVTDQMVSPPPPERGRILRRAVRHRSRGAETNRAAAAAREEAEETLAALEGCVEALSAALPRLRTLKRQRLVGKVEEEQSRVQRASALLREARTAVETADLGACGKAVEEAHRQLSSVGGPLTVALNAELAEAAFPRAQQEALQDNLAQRRRAHEAAANEPPSPRAAVLAWVPVYNLMAEGFHVAADIIEAQASPAPRSRARPGTGAEVRVVPPQELETFADVGGLDRAKEDLRRVIDAVINEPASRTLASHNGVLLHGPPGTGKTLLARAAAGEYGLRFIRFSPAVIASAYQHEPAKRLRQVFEVAAESAPCLLFLDEVDTIGGRREGTTVDQREVVTELLNSLEEYRSVPGLLLMAATNTVDELDPALREGRFDTRIAVPLPDASTREAIFEVELERRADEVDWESIDLAEVAQRTTGRSGAAVASIVAGAAARARSQRQPLTQAELLTEIDARSGQDRAQTVEEHVEWSDVVLPEAAQRRLQEILLVFQRPELARQVGVLPPAGILLHGPPGTGKTTIAKALATEVKASFYEQSAADLLSKWVGESEKKIAQLFARARANRPSIIFCDEVESLLKRRMGDSATPWEERVVTQFLRELDGLHSGDGVLFVGATNRPDMVDEAVRQRRLVPIEIPLPDRAGRARLLEVLCREVRMGSDVDLDEIARATEGMSGADLKSLRNAAGMRALTTGAARQGPSDLVVRRVDFAAVLAERGVGLEARPVRKVSGKRVARRRPAAGADETVRRKNSGNA